VDFDTFIAFSKVAGATVSGALGVAGILFDFRSADGKLTKSGVAVLLGILLSAGATILSSVAEGYKAISDAAEQTARTEKLLSQIERAASPITKLDVTYWIQLPRSIPIVDRYCRNIAVEVERNLNKLTELNLVADEKRQLHISSFDAAGSPLSVEIPFQSDVWPKGEDQPLGDAAAFYNLSLFICRTPKDIKSFEPVIGGSNSCDLSAWTFGLPLSNQLSYSPRFQTIEIFGRTDLPKELWKSNGRIISVADLRGAQIFLVSPMSANLSEKFKQFQNATRNAIQQEGKIRVVVIKVAEGREIWIGGSKLRREIGRRDGSSIFSIVLPKEESEWSKLCELECK
jgi:hypothetical protein